MIRRITNKWIRSAKSKYLLLKPTAYYTTIQPITHGWLKKCDIIMVVDIRNEIRQYLEMQWRIFLQAVLYCLELLAEGHTKHTKNYNNGHSFIRFYQSLCDKQEEIAFYIRGNRSSSSILPMNKIAS